MSLKLNRVNASSEGPDPGVVNSLGPKGIWPTAVFKLEV